MHIVTSLQYGRTWFCSHNCARELSHVQSVLYGCHPMPCTQYVPVALSAGNNPFES